MYNGSRIEQLQETLKKDGIKTFTSMYYSNILISFEDIRTDFHSVDIVKIAEGDLAVYVKCKIMQELRNRIKEIQETL